MAKSAPRQAIIIWQCYEPSESGKMRRQYARSLINPVNETFIDSKLRRKIHQLSAFDFCFAVEVRLIVERNVEGTIYGTVGAAFARVHYMAVMD